MDDPVADRSATSERGLPTDAELLADAFGVEPGSLRPIGREPLGRGSVAGFEVTHAADGESPAVSIAYVDTSGLAVVAETGLVLEGVARVWTHPADPHLPALAPAAFGGAVEALLARLGIAVEGAPEFVAYRPGRRAVLRVAADGGSVWIKAVRPSRVERIVEAHRLLRQAGLPVPAIRGWSPEGILVIDQADGTPATEAEWDPDALLRQADALRERLAGVQMSWTARTGVPERLPWYAERAVAAMPQHRERIERVREGCRIGLGQPASQVHGIHGDLHLGQLFLTGRGTEIRITGLIDADTAGTGDPDEDAAAFLAHAAASALLTEGDGLDRIWALAENAMARWPGRRTAALAAIHLLGHALTAALAEAPQRAEDLLLLAETVVTGAGTGLRAAVARAVDGG